MTNSHHAAGGPDVPTIAEAGYPELTFDGLVGLFGPRAMAPELRDHIAAEIREVASDPEITAKLIATGQVVNPGGAAEFAASIEHQRAAVESFAQALGVRPSSQ